MTIQEFHKMACDVAVKNGYDAVVDFIQVSVTLHNRNNTTQYTCSVVNKLVICTQGNVCKNIPEALESFDIALRQAAIAKSTTTEEYPMEIEEPTAKEESEVENA